MAEGSSLDSFKQLESVLDAIIEEKVASHVQDIRAEQQELRETVKRLESERISPKKTQAKAQSADEQEEDGDRKDNTKILQRFLEMVITKDTPITSVPGAKNALESLKKSGQCTKAINLMDKFIFLNGDEIGFKKLLIEHGAKDYHAGRTYRAIKEKLKNMCS
ncbi:uncharacterized protein LOC118419189 [Branchiostoma floridae]|uniref:Uncharacterized protein LOC118419189 n=1 Tax=Branchiostoma floridae TaxID=7739 RepID=A0A9J7LG00_BRAFL|nr:uncharacterized protein LOC118419189 [Branchiostoma floridae]